MARILIAEDEEALRLAMVSWLDGAGHTVRACADGAQADRALADADADLLVLDVQLPELSGPMILARQDRSRAPVPCIMITGNPELPEVQALVAARRVHLLPKPFSLRSLGELIEVLLATC